MEGKSAHYENLSTIKVIGHGETIFGLCRSIWSALSVSITDVKKTENHFMGRQQYIKKSSLLCGWEKRSGMRKTKALNYS